MNTNSKKICFLKRHLSSIGGLEKYTRYLVNAYVERGHEVTFLTSDYRTDYPIDERVEVVPVGRGLSLNAIRAYDAATFKWLKEHPQDVIFGLDRTRFQTHIRAGNGIHRAFLDRRRQIDPWLKQQTYFLNPTHHTILDIEKRALESKDLKKLFTNSHMVKREALKYYDIPESKIQVIHNGVEYDELAKPFSEWEKTREATLEELGLSGNDHQFLFIGNGYHRKGLIPLLRGLAKLKAFPFHLTVVGKEKNTASYRRLVRSLGLSGRVSFLGVQPQIMKFYAMADTLVIPSYYDPFANVTLEALAMGVFVISSLTNGGSEIITPSNGATIRSLFDDNCIVEALKGRIEARKTPSEAEAIRASVAHLNFSKQLNTMIDACLE